MNNVVHTLFTSKAKAYAEYRSAYPEAAISKILGPLEGLPGITAMDAGAGTGIGSRLLAKRGVRVLAIEPNAAMIESAEPHPLVTFRQAPAERTGAPDSCVDVVTAFQAFHWFDFKRSLREFRRVLKPAGRLALVWQALDEQDPFTGRFVHIIRETARRNPRRVPRYRGLAGQIKRLRMMLLRRCQWLPCFTGVTRHRFPHAMEMDTQSLIGLARSQSAVPDEGPAWESLVADVCGLASGCEKPVLSYVVDVFTAVPRPRFRGNSRPGKLATSVTVE